MKRVLVSSVISILIGMLVVGCREKAQDERLVITATLDPAEVYVAIVNGVGIPRRDLDHAILHFGDTESALNYLTDERLLMDYAQTHGLEITPEQVEAEVQALQALATQNQADIAQITGYPADQLADYVRWTLLVAAVGNDLTKDMPNTVMQVHARQILVGDKQQALDILRQLDAGADFAELAKQYSLDSSTAPLGGDLGWIAPNELLQSEVEDILFAMPANSRWGQPIVSRVGYHIVESLGQAERPLTKEQFAQQRQSIFDEWLAQQRSNAIIERYVASS